MKEKSQLFTIICTLVLVVTNAYGGNFFLTMVCLLGLAGNLGLYFLYKGHYLPSFASLALGMLVGLVGIYALPDRRIFLIIFEAILLLMTGLSVYYWKKRG